MKQAVLFLDSNIENFEVVKIFNNFQSMLNYLNINEHVEVIMCGNQIDEKRLYNLLTMKKRINLMKMNMCRIISVGKLKE